VGLLPAAGNSLQPQPYRWTDTALHWGWHAYRLVLMSGRGDSVLGDTLRHFREGILLPQQPLFLGQPLAVQFYAQEKTTYVLLMRSRAGQEVKRKAGFVPPGSSRKLIDLDEVGLGDYALLIQTPNQRVVRVIRIRPDGE